MGFFRSVVSSITNFPAYGGFARESTGRALKYFFLIFTLVFIGYAIKLTPVITGFVDKLGQEVESNVPDFRIINGELEFKEKMPFIIKGDNNFILIIDTTGELNPAALDKYNNGVFVEKTKAVIKDEQQGTNTINFTAFKGMEISRDALLKILPLMKKFIPIIIVGLYIFGLLSKMITLLVLAVIGLAMRSGADIRFGHTWNIACHALTLPLLLDLVKSVAVPMLPGFFLVYFGIAIFYMYKGVQAAKENRNDAGPVIPV